MFVDKTKIPKTKIIADVGANHGGNIALAKKMIQVAAESGVDFVKFQSWQSKNLKRSDPNFARQKQTELSDEDHYILMEECTKNKVQFLTTCFDLHRADFLAKLGLKYIKVASPDAASYTLIRKLCENFEHLIVSTGMTYDEELLGTIDILRGHDYTLLHCVSLYPTPVGRVNLARMDWLKQFTPSVGFSDHTMGTQAGKLAIARGASFLEKHFTIDRNLLGKDQPISGLPEEFIELSTYANCVCEMLGEEHPPLSDAEKELRKIYIGKWGDNK